MRNCVIALRTAGRLSAGMTDLILPNSLIAARRDLHLRSVRVVDLVRPSELSDAVVKLA